MTHAVRLLFLLSLILISLAGLAQTSAANDLSNYRRTLVRMAAATQDGRSRIPVDETLFRDIGRSGDPLYIAPLLDTAYFLRGSQVEDAVLLALEQLTDMKANLGWQAFFEWASENDVALPPHYDEFKGLLLSSVIDPEFDRFFAPGVQESAEVNLLEAVWGGVRVDGIPSLVNAKQITPEEARLEGETFIEYCRGADCSYPAQDELVFGVSIGGDNRAYPLRLLNWHEMFNDVIGHTPMLETLEGEAVCNFRAPTDFRALGYQMDANAKEWVNVSGESAGCPESGWLAADTLEWEGSNWSEVKGQLPDLATQEPLEAEEGIVGRVSGRPIMLAYCTLCGAGVLYDATISDLSYTDLEGNAVSLGETVLEFGSTGMLMRSNKLMYDRLTDTVWNALTGVPAFGPLANSEVRLERLPVIVSDWETWLSEHPDTSVLSLQTGFQRNYSNGGAYEDYFNNPEFVMFPVWQQDTSVTGNKDMVFAVELESTPKAYPLELLIEEGVTNDTLGETDLVIVSRATPERDFFEPGGAAVRAFERANHTFSAGASDDELIDETGEVWQMSENALTSSAGETLERLPGHLAFWFGWYGFHPDTLVYGDN